ncbi:MAG: glycosyltransferase family 4 protein, partial [Acidimicrobiales bacterium]
LVRELRRRGHPVRGLVVGDGPLEAEVRRLAEGAGVEVLGRRMDVPDILASADVFAFTSVPESEGMPGVLIEAGMAGVPVVATKTPGATTVIAEGETGYVVPFDDFDALVGAVEKLVLDPDRRAAMGAAARRRCEHDFSLEVVHRGWRTLLDSLSPRLPTAEPAASRVGP